MPMDPELERWKAAGRSFDYLGFDVFYRTAGSGPSLLLIHGYPFNSWDWAPIWDTLTELFTVIAPDMPGMGFSDKPGAYEYSVGDHADMHEALLAELGVQSAHILAHDLGDSVGQELLARHEFSEQVYGSLRIESVTWLNGGLFNEAYTPRLLQKAMSQTPLGDIMSPLQGSSLSRRLIEPTINEMFGPDTKPSRRMLPIPPDPRVQRRQARDTQGGQVRQGSIRTSQSVGTGDAADVGPHAIDRRPRRPELRAAHG